MVCLVLMMIECVIQIVLKVLVEEQCENLVQVSLEAWQSVGKPKGHHAEAKGAIQGHKHGLPFISRSDLDLVVP